ncbi:hypothetical protein EJB05_26810, partial [Eragrostis curvula]
MDRSLSPSFASSSSDSRQPHPLVLQCLPPPQLSNNDGFPGSSRIQPSDAEEAIACENTIHLAIAVGRKTNKEDQGQIQFVPMEAMNMMDLRQFLWFQIAIAWMQHGEAAGSKTMEMPGMGVRRLAAKSEWEQDEDGETSSYWSTRREQGKEERANLVHTEIRWPACGPERAPSVYNGICQTKEDL